jgi:hypothetical protein
MTKSPTQPVCWGRPSETGIVLRQQGVVVVLLPQGVHSVLEAVGAGSGKPVACLAVFSIREASNNVS